MDVPATERRAQKRSETSPTQYAVGAEFVQIDGALRGSAYDETTVDIIAVPCPGADPYGTWTRDPLVEGSLGRSTTKSIDSKGADGKITSAASSSAATTRSTRSATATMPSWVRQGIRREASMARVLLYRHPDLAEGLTLSNLADALLLHIERSRPSESTPRPLLFICHSVGGIVVKLALRKASRNPVYANILSDCYGVAFFATPHRGSNYLSMPEIATSIQSLLQLSAPMPKSIMDDLRIGHPLLQHVDEDFRALSGDIQIWTFYEMVDSKIASRGETQPGDVYLTAPITNLRSAILGIRQEKIYPLHSDHANIASFGKKNTQTLRIFLGDLGRCIHKADVHARTRVHYPMHLELKVPVEIHGFYDDLGAATAVGAQDVASIRAWSTKVPLKEFITKGPDQCLEDRLDEVDDGAPDRQFFNRGRATILYPIGVLAPEAEPSGPSDTEPQALEIPDSEGGEDPSSIQATHGDGTPTQVSPDPNVSFTDPFTEQSPSIPQPVSPNSGPTSGMASVDGGETLSHSSLGILETRSVSASPAPALRRSGSHSETTASQRPRRSQGITRRFTDQFGGRWSPQANGSLFRGPSPFDRSVRDDDDESGMELCAPVVFARPVADRRRFVWIHLPFTNPTWVKTMFETLEVKYGRDFTEVLNHGNWYSKHSLGRHAQHYAYYVKPSCDLILPRPLSPLTQSTILRQSEPILYLFMPYLHFDSYKNLLRRRELIRRRLNQGRTRPVPQTVSKSESLELQVAWEFLGHDPPVNERRTLDQYGYPSLHDTRPRDDDQMLYKMTKEGDFPSYPLATEPGFYEDTQSSLRGSALRRNPTNGPSSGKDCESSDSDEMSVEPDDDIRNGNVLMVDQVWLWAIGPKTLLTFFPRRESDTTEGPLYQQADLRDSLFNDINADMTRQCETTFDLAALAVLHAVTVLLDRASHPDLEIFRIFEEAISILTEKMTSSLKAFRAQGLRDKTSDLDTTETREGSIRARHIAEGKQAERENRDSTSALLELRDLEDELATLGGLFERQERVVRAMRHSHSRATSISTSTVPDVGASSTGGQRFLTEALERLAEYRRRAGEMARRARSTREDFDKLLEMAQRQAQVDEVRLQRLQADLASAQARSVTIFTTFTVIFLPLGFFTSLFGMNTREWQENVPTLQTIGIISLPASAFLISAALIVAWNTTVRRTLASIADLRPPDDIPQRTYQVVQDALGLLRPRREEDESVDMGERGERRRARAAERERRRERRRLLKEASLEAQDFWERHRLGREYAYRVPAANRRGGRDLGGREKRG